MELLDEIRQVEGDGERLIAKAKQDADELIRLAREEGRNLLESSKEECRRTELQMIADAESEAQRQALESRKENQKALESLRASAQNNMERAVKLIIDSIAGNPEWP